MAFPFQVRFTLILLFKKIKMPEGVKTSFFYQQSQAIDWRFILLLGISAVERKLLCYNAVPLYAWELDTISSHDPQH